MNPAPIVAALGGAKEDQSRDLTGRNGDGANHGMGVGGSWTAEIDAWKGGDERKPWRAQTICASPGSVSTTAFSQSIAWTAEG